MSNPTKSEPAFFRAATHRPEVIAHRGGGGEWPGETVYAFKKAIELGVDVLEMDVRRTKDDQLVLFHSSRVDETTDGTGRVRDLSLKELQKLNAAASMPGFGHQPIPELSEALDLLNTHPGLRLNIELKERDTKVAVQLAETLKHYAVADRVLVASGWHSALRKFREVCPEVATSASVYEVELFDVFDRFLGLKYRPHTDAIQWYSKFSFLKVITRRFIDKAHSLDLKVHAWTVNEPEEMKRLIALGVDGIITDLPTTLMKVLGRTSP
jgi:glycerophosphoryl diester phosphodiesterase